MNLRSIVGVYRRHWRSIPSPCREQLRRPFEHLAGRWLPRCMSSASRMSSGKTSVSFPGSLVSRPFNTFWSGHSRASRRTSNSDARAIAKTPKLMPRNQTPSVACSNRRWPLFREEVVAVSIHSCSSQSQSMRDHWDMFSYEYASPSEAKLSLQVDVLLLQMQLFPISRHASRISLPRPSGLDTRGDAVKY